MEDGWDQRSGLGFVALSTVLLHGLVERPASGLGMTIFCWLVAGALLLFIGWTVSDRKRKDGSLLRPVGTAQWWILHVVGTLILLGFVLGLVVLTLCAVATKPVLGLAWIAAFLGLVPWRNESVNHRGDKLADAP